MQSAIDREILESHGSVSFTLPSSAESDLRGQLLALATCLGAPVAARSGGCLCDVLLPTEANAARPRSLSKLYATGQFPLHIDTAHWLVPCRYVMLGCVSPGSGNRSTLLLDTRRLPLNEQQIGLLRSTPLRIASGRNSFFSTVLSNARPFVRFDPGCMAPTSPDGAEALEVLAHCNWPDHVEAICWEPGTVLVIDNWRLLHGRSHAAQPDPDRKLLRVSIR